MAIHPVVSSPAPASPPENVQPTASEVLEAPTAPTPAARVQLAIPLDDDEAVAPRALRTDVDVRARKANTKPVPRRDSLKRREALLRGKEGSRRRQRWENDHLIHNPHAIPPTQDDWEPHPVYPKKNVPYQYASLWDHPNFPHRKTKVAEAADRVPRELKVRIKKARGAISLLRNLEEEVRLFVFGAQIPDIPLEPEPEPEDAVDMRSGEEDSEEEIVFVSKKTREHGLVRREKILFESLAEDSSASFGRWLVHSIANYYGLKSWSVTSGNPAKRFAYIGMPSLTPSTRTSSKAMLPAIPKPLYLML